MISEIVEALKTRVNVRLKEIVNFFCTCFFRLSLGLVGVEYFSLMGCQSPSRNESHAFVPQASIENGKILAGQYCQSCHELPNPALLDANTWETGVLPAMGPKLGIFNFKGKSYAYGGDGQMMGPGYVSSSPKVTAKEWESIVDYYTATSPDVLPEQNRSEKISMDLPLFEVIKPQLNYKNAQTCFVEVREDSETAIIVSDAITLKTYFLNIGLIPVDSLVTRGPLVNLDFLGENEALICNMGILRPTDDTLGTAVRMNRSSGRWMLDSINVARGLRRPMQVLQADLNNDNKIDNLICEFGYLRGSLSWIENKGIHRYEKHVVSPLPGVLKAFIFDYNRDGKKDILALFAQGEEGIFLYINNGNGSFEEKKLLRFPAVYGSSSFELADFNKDGLQDILYTCGDNADYSTVLKPYHGVYIFLNKGEDTFEQSFFYPINGCYKAMAKDFDKDGDLDLATIAYYADFATQPEEGFVYLENKGDLEFEPYSIVQLQIGRWITMDVGDVDRDGWPDIVLGNFFQPSKRANRTVNWANAAPAVVLKNKGR